MNGTTDHTKPTWLRAASGVSAAFVVILMFFALAWLRRNPDEIHGVFVRGNTLGTHEGSGLSSADFSRVLGHVELALLATLLAASARRWSRGPLYAWIAGLACFSGIYADSIARYTTTIHGRLYFYLCDDALISMRYARNFAEGRGLVYNAGEAVDGFTNPLWTALMVVPHALGLHEGVAPLAIMLLGGALLIGTAALARHALRDDGVEPALQVAIAFAMLFDASIFEFSVIGLETPLLGFAAALVMAGGLTKRRSWIWIGLALVTLGRADGAIIATILFAWLVIEDRATSGDPLAVVARRHAKTFVVLVGVAATLVVWRLAVYGHPAPNTYYLKVYPLAARLRNGLLSYGIRGIIMYGLPVAFVVFTTATDERARRARRLLLPVIGVWLYAVYVGGDAFSYMRFVGPMTPLLWTAVALAAAAGWARRSHRVNGFVIPLVALAVPVVSERGVLGSTWDRAPMITQFVLAAKTVTSNVPEDAEVATFYAGFTYYAPTRRFVDVLGKTERHIAHENEIHGVIPGHNKFDFAWVYGQRKPAVTFTSLSCDEVDQTIPRKPEVVASLSADLPRYGFQAPVAQLLDDRFRELYYPQRVVLRDGGNPAGHPLGCWFVRKDAPVPIVWQVAYE